jgi:hypothetical protein
MSWAHKLVQHCMLTLSQDNEDDVQHVWLYELYASCSDYSFALIRHVALIPS